MSERDGALVFTVATIRLWFAAQALRKGWIGAAALVGDLPRLRRWQDALSIFIATADFDSAARYFEPLAAMHPAVAAAVITDATTSWGGNGQERTLGVYRVCPTHLALPRGVAARHLAACSLL